MSWSRANPWGQPADSLSQHPACTARRLEALLSLLQAAARDAAGADGRAIDILGGEVVRHAVALAEILAQHTVAGSLLELQVAAALLAAGLALPAFPMARHWTALAVLALQRGFEAMIDPDGAVAEASYHRSLEILTLALVLIPILKARPDLTPLAGILDARVPKAWAGMVALFEPDGALPPFGDTPGHADRYRWLERWPPRMAGPGWPRPTPGGRATDGPAPPERAGPEPSSCAGRGTGRLVRLHGRFLRAGRPTGSPGLHLLHLRYRRPALDHRERGPAPGDGAGAQCRHPGRPGTGCGSGLRAGGLPLGRCCRALHRDAVHGPDYRHVRAFVLLDDLSGLAVFDRFRAGHRPLTAEGFLHLDAEVTVALDPSRRIFGLRDERRLQIVPHAISGRLDDLALSRASFGPRGNHGAPAGPVLRYGLSGTGILAGGLLIASSAGGVSRLAAAIEEEAFRRALTD